MLRSPSPARFTPEEADAAGAEWRFNCGPGALCGVLGLRPEEVRPHMGDFEQRGYTNPTLMFQALESLRAAGKLVSFRTLEGSPVDRNRAPFWPPFFGLARVQWGGPWTKEGVPIRARYRKTHWVGCWSSFEALAAAHLSGATQREAHEGARRIFDINATCAGGWIPFREWAEQLVPWLLNQCEPKADGSWWITHSIDINPGNCQPQRARSL